LNADRAAGYRLPEKIPVSASSPSVEPIVLTGRHAMGFATVKAQQRRTRRAPATNQEL
jgi:hypothetical protein